MKLSRIELSFELENAGCFVSSVLRGSLKEPTIVLKLSDGKELPMLEKDLISAMCQLETVLEHLGVLRGDIKDRGVDVEAINQALLNNTVNIGASGLAEPAPPDAPSDDTCNNCGAEVYGTELCFDCAEEIRHMQTFVDEVSDAINGPPPATPAELLDRLSQAIRDGRTGTANLIKRRIKDGANRCFAVCVEGNIADAERTVPPRNCVSCLGCGGLPGEAVSFARGREKIRSIKAFRLWATNHDFPMPELREAKETVESWMAEWQRAVDRGVTADAEEELVATNRVNFPTEG